MRHYFLFGTVAVDEYTEGGVDNVCTWDGCVHSHKPGTDSPSSLLGGYDGHGAFCEITEDEYNKLKIHFES